MVSLLVASNAKTPEGLPASVDVITLDVSAPIPYHVTPECSARFVEAAFAKTFSETMDIWFQLDYEMNADSTEECDSLHQNQELIAKLEAPRAGKL